MEDNYKGIGHKWELTKKEKDFIDYCVRSGYKIISYKQYQSKTKVKVFIEKDIIENWELSNNGGNFNSILFDKNVKLAKEIKRLKAKIKEVKGIKIE